jgi:DNA-binding phage protein
VSAAETLSRKFEALARVLDERTRRLVAGAEAAAIGFAGVTMVAQASGLSRGTVIRGWNYTILPRLV